MIAPNFGFNNQSLFFRYEVPVTAKTRAFIDLGYTNAEARQLTYKPFGLHGNAWRATAGASHVLLNNENSRLKGYLALDFKEGDTDSGPDDIERESVRTLRAGFNYDRQWGKTSLTSWHELGWGFAAMGGSLSNARNLPLVLGGSQYLRYTGTASIIREFDFLDSNLALNTQWQYSPQSMASFDVYGIGGTFAGRGYRELYIPGDSAFVGSLEWQVPAKFFPERWQIPFIKQPLNETLTLVSFLDYGYAHLNNPPIGTDPSEHILSAGAGVRVKLTDRVSGRLDVGFPLLRQAPFSNSPRLHVGLDVVLF